MSDHAGSVGAMTDTATTDTVRFEHDGTAWEIPASLVATQRAWDAANAECIRLADGPDRDAYQGARVRRLDLTDELYESPWLEEAARRGQRVRADQALKACARGGQTSA